MEEDELSGQQDKGLLEERQKQLALFQKISNYLRDLIEKEKLFYVRESPVEKEFIDIMPDVYKNLDITYLNLLASKLLSKNDFEIDLSTIFIDDSTISIVDEMERIKHLLLEKKEVDFTEVSGKYILLIDKIICFLSILELYKNEFIDIIQFENFGDIRIRALNR
jgi:chromatin segregation and condensation protein Rec8/ScpA/Scc1 (kleisin family)